MTDEQCESWYYFPFIFSNSKFKQKKNLTIILSECIVVKFYNEKKNSPKKRETKILKFGLINIDTI